MLCFNEIDDNERKKIFIWLMGTDERFQNNAEAFNKYRGYIKNDASLVEDFPDVSYDFILRSLEEYRPPSKGTNKQTNTQKKKFSKNFENGTRKQFLCCLAVAHFFFLLKKKYHVHFFNNMLGARFSPFDLPIFI
jgi:hypothetical protein